MSKPYPILVEALVQIAASNDGDYIAEIARNAARRILSAEALAMIRSEFTKNGDGQASSPVVGPPLPLSRDPSAVMIAGSIGGRTRSTSYSLSFVGEGEQAHLRDPRLPAWPIPEFDFDDGRADAIGGEIAAAQTLARAASAAISRCVDLRELTETQAHLTFVRDEARHRLKNVYASAIGLANLSLPKEHSTEFAQRLRTLAEVHNFLDTDHEENPGILLGELLATVLSPYHDTGMPRISADGPKIEVSSTVALALGLLANELATNALKYGALSVVSGKILIRWAYSEGGIGLWWNEVGGPETDCSAASNQGSKLMGTIVENLLHGSMEHVITQSGVRFSVLFPMD
ncbi:MULTISPECIES: sensor histidine kinase [unclassified Rhizobium]|uniref:sensor histidine kinase n=1 Tax=unclassified Rhizobium TaxID=2613769 RepID=UPI001ADBAB86|nr:MULTISPECIES: HWE histidine kinase domain-containing protein [unclassified Rhizobium]MBO9127980.1 hypothetical protein [Rhizobium sp. 16-488-2b]MBO9178557.1 hypothetical protein [Rhizobium sp. 16-488-2a]